MRNIFDHKYSNEDEVEPNNNFIGFGLTKNGTNRVMVGMCLFGQGAFINISPNVARQYANDLLAALDAAQES